MLRTALPGSSRFDILVYRRSGLMHPRTLLELAKVRQLALLPTETQRRVARSIYASALTCVDATVRRIKHPLHQDKVKPLVKLVSNLRHPPDFDETKGGMKLNCGMIGTADTRDHHMFSMLAGVLY